MKKKAKLIFSFLAAGLAVLALTACDMTFIDGPFTANGNHAAGGSANPFGSGYDSGYNPYFPYLTIANLPADTQKDHFSDVFVYDSLGTVTAKCADYNLIVITDSDYAVARIPLVDNGSGKPFSESGIFNASFSLFDSSAQDAKNTDSSFSAAFTNGSGNINFLKNDSLPAERGYFSGGLDNPFDGGVPVIRSGTVFEMNGVYYTAKTNKPAAADSFSNTCVVYVYARLLNNQLEFACSTAKPEFDIHRNGYYNGFERALYKFVFIRDSSDKCFEKTFINNAWSQFSYQTAEDGNLASQNLSRYYYLSGDGNPLLQTVTLPAGAYVFALNGASGGSASGAGYYLSSSLPASATGPHSGGAGGRVSEVVTLSKNTTVAFFTGASGGNGNSGSTYDHGSTGYGDDAHEYTSTYTFYSGAGGGSGTFIFSSEGYFLCAGGGGGAGSGAGLYDRGYESSSDPRNSGLSSGAPGGAGGSIGGGGAGPSSSGAYGRVLFVQGGKGGGSYNGSSALAYNGYSGAYIYSYSLGFSAAAEGYAVYYNLSPPNDWLNTNGANGSGGNSYADGQAGGNNRNSARGGGGGSGSISVYKIN